MLHTPILKADIELSKIPIYDDLMIDWQLMGANEFKVDVELPGKLIAPIGSEIYYKGNSYVINTAPSVQKLGERKFRYSIVFESAPLYRLYDKKLRHLGNRTFQYFGKPSRFAELIVSNINEIDPGWTVGPCEDLDEKTINFSGHTCRTALDLVAETFNIEWDVPGKTISFLKQVGTTTPYVFRYGMGNGLYSLAYQYQNDKNIVTRAYGYGSPKNLPENYRSGATQLMFDEVCLEKNTDLYGIKEGDYENGDIYPEVMGTVSDAPAWFPDSAVFYVSDDSLDFDLNAYKSVDIPKLSFKTGQLQGQNFEIIDFINTTKTYKLKVFQDSNSNTLPNAVFKAQPGDTYTLFDMPLPTERVLAAESKLKAATQEWLNTNSVPQVLYSLELDPLYARNNNIMLKPGDRVRIQDDDLGIDEMIRVTKVNYPYNFPEVITKSTKIIVEIANFVPYTLTERALSDIIDTKHEVKTVISDSNFQKRLAERVKTLTGVDYLPAGTAIVDPETGTISANLINADYIVVRNLITGKWRITAAANNIRMVDESTNKIMMLLDDDSAYEGSYFSLSAPIDNPDGTPDPNYLGSTIRVVNGADVMYYKYAKRGPGMTVGTPGTATTSIGRSGVTSADNDGVIQMETRLDLETGRGSIKHNVSDGLFYTGLLNKTSGLRESVQLKIEVINGKKYVVADEAQVDPERMYNPNVVADAGDNGTDNGGVIDPVDPPDENPPTTSTTLNGNGFPFGVMVKRGFLGYTNGVNVAQAHARSIVDENDGKPKNRLSSEGSAGMYDVLLPNMQWAKANGKKVTIHTGWWPGREPDKWKVFFADPTISTETKEAELKWQIQAPLLYFKGGEFDGLIENYDAFNEAFNEAPVINSTGRIWKDSVVTDALGDGVYKRVIQYAKEADPRVNILSNDYGAEYGWLKVDAWVNFANECIAENIPLDGFGFQLHAQASIGLTGLKESIQRMVDIGMKIRFSEVALSMLYIEGSDENFTPEMEEIQANKYVQILDAIMDIVPVALFIELTTWGIINADYMGSAVNENAMLFNDDGTPKLAYLRMVARMIERNSQQELPL